MEHLEYGRSWSHALVSFTSSEYVVEGIETRFGAFLELWRVLGSGRICRRCLPAGIQSRLEVPLEGFIRIVKFLDKWIGG